MSPVKVNCSHCLGNKNEHLSLCRRHFKATQNTWYKKLEKSGFEDIEQGSTFKSGADDGNLKQWHGGYFRTDKRYSTEAFQAKEEYYQLAGQFLHSYHFANKQEKGIWELHSRGFSIVSIHKVLGGLGIKFFSGKKANKRNVHETIQKLVKLMLSSDPYEQK